MLGQAAIDEQHGAGDDEVEKQLAPHHRNVQALTDLAHSPSSL